MGKESLVQGGLEGMRENEKDTAVWDQLMQRRNKREKGMKRVYYFAWGEGSDCDWETSCLGLCV